MRREAGHITREGEFFRRSDAELIEHMRKCDELRRQQRMVEAATHPSAELEQQRLRIAEAIGIDDPEVLHTLQHLGYDSSTALLVFLVPLIQIAWIDGSVSRAERDLVLSIANEHGIRPDMPGYSQLLVWLDRRPREIFLQGSMCAVRAVIQALAPEQRRERTRNLLLDCRQVASVSGGILNKVCAAERTLLAHIEQMLESQPESAAQGAGAGR